LLTEKDAQIFTLWQDNPHVPGAGYLLGLNSRRFSSSSHIAEERKSQKLNWRQKSQPKLELPNRTQRDRFQKAAGFAMNVGISQANDHIKGLVISTQEIKSQLIQVSDRNSSENGQQQIYHCPRNKTDISRRI